MRTSPILDALFPSIRRKILAATLLSPEKSWFLSELAAHLRTSPSSLQRELDSLTKCGVLRRKMDGRRTYYRAHTASPVFHELRLLFSKTAGIIPTLQSAIARFGEKISWAAVYGSVARGAEQPQSGVDLVIVGPLAMAALLPVLRKVERQFGREVNVMRFSENEFADKLRGGDHFVKSLVGGKLITIVGSPHELEKAPRRT